MLKSTVGCGEITLSIRVRAHDRALTTTEQDFEGGNPNLDRGLVREKRDF